MRDETLKKLEYFVDNDIKFLTTNLENLNELIKKINETIEETEKTIKIKNDYLFDNDEKLTLNEYNRLCDEIESAEYDIELLEIQKIKYDLEFEKIKSLLHELSEKSYKYCSKIFDNRV